MSKVKAFILCNIAGFAIGYTIQSCRVLYLRHKLKKIRKANEDLARKIVANTLAYPMYTD